MATLVAKGRKLELKNLPLTSSDDTQIGFSQPVNSVIIKCRTAADIYIRGSRGGASYYTLASGTTIQLDLVGDAKEGVIQPTNIWLRGSGSVVAEVIGIYGG